MQFPHRIEFLVHGRLKLAAVNKYVSETGAGGRRKQAAANSSTVAAHRQQ
jgi:hypothetical protein